MKKINSNITSLFNQNETTSMYAEFANKKTGSYRRLLKTYYSDQKKMLAEEKKNRDELAALINKKDLETSKPELTQMKKESDGLKTAADSLMKDSVWEEKNGAYDIEGITKAIKSFANEYNDVVSQSAKVKSKDIEQTYNYMSSLTSTMSKAMAKVGVNVDKDGKISVDEDAVKTADVKTLKSIFGNKTSYAAQIADKAHEISKDTVLNTALYSNKGYLPNNASSIFNTNI